jgi:hypothetical protein
MPSSHVMENKWLYFYNKEFLRPMCGLLYRLSHFVWTSLS